MTLDDIEAPIFGYFVNWLYVHRMVDAEGHNLNLVDYAKLWVLADRFRMKILAEIILMAVEQSKADDIAGGGNTLQDLQAYVYSACPGPVENSPLKKAAIEKTMNAITSDNRRKPIDSFPEGMLVDFTEAVLDKCDGMSGRLDLWLGCNFCRPQASSSTRPAVVNCNAADTSSDSNSDLYFDSGTDIE